MSFRAVDSLGLCNDDRENTVIEDVSDAPSTAAGREVVDPSPRAARAPMTRTSTFTAARGVRCTGPAVSICDALTAHPGPVGLHPATRVGPLVHAWSRSRGSATATCSFPHAHGVLSPSHSTLCGLCPTSALRAQPLSAQSAAGLQSATPYRDRLPAYSPLAPIASQSPSPAHAMSRLLTLSAHVQL
jgi:hypothetical protein